MSIKFDYLRQSRVGLPEAVLCEGKTTHALAEILNEFKVRRHFPVLMTRLSSAQIDALPFELKEFIDYDSNSKTAFWGGCLPSRKGLVAIVSAGTADQMVATEVRRTLQFLGVDNSSFADVGVSALWRLEESLPAISRCEVVVVIAGMDAALTSVLGGAVANPVIAVPTSTGYGVACGGHVALNAMLSSCAAGVPVMNIDNGFGAAYAAVRILNLIYPHDIKKSSRS